MGGGGSVYTSQENGFFLEKATSLVMDTNSFLSHCNIVMCTAIIQCTRPPVIRINIWTTGKTIDIIFLNTGFLCKPQKQIKYWCLLVRHRWYIFGDMKYIKNKNILITPFLKKYVYFGLILLITFVPNCIWFPIYTAL